MSTLEQLYQLAADVAPELSPLYIIRSPEWHPLNKIARAFAVGYDSPMMTSHLTELGIFQGPGPVVCFVACKVEHLAPVLLHELAHLVEYKPPAKCREATAEMVEFERTLMREEVETSPPDPWFMHEASFIRAGLHLHHRALARGYNIDGSQMRLAGENYELSPPACYAVALGDEPCRMMGASFEEIMATPAPQAFTNLFADDCRRYHELKEPQCKPK